MERKGAFHLTVALCVFVAVLSQAAIAKYGGGTGEPDDPYLIYTPEQMNAIGADPNDWDKHFKLMADLDLSAYTGDQFNMIGRRMSRGLGLSEVPFAGVFDGNARRISNFTYTGQGQSDTGLFRYVDGPNAEIRDLGLIAPEVYAWEGTHIGALVGNLRGGTIANCRIEEGVVEGRQYVGGMVGAVGNPVRGGAIHAAMLTGCYGNCEVSGGSYVGGLAGYTEGLIQDCHATGNVVGRDNYVGGLVGSGHDTIADSYAGGFVTGIADCVGGVAGSVQNVVNCHADGIVRGRGKVGGLAGYANTILNCYAHGIVIGDEHVGGLAGDASSITNSYASAFVRGTTLAGGLVGLPEPCQGTPCDIVASFWDIETSGQMISGGGQDKTSAQMQTLITFLTWGEGENEGIWTIDEGNDYPRLAWENRPGVAIGSMAFSDLLAGAGTSDDPYLIYTAEQMDLVGQFPNQWDRHYKLMADLDLGTFAGDEFHRIGHSYPSFQGTFDGNGHTISNFTCVSADGNSAGFFDSIRGENSEIRNLGVICPVVDVFATAGALAGHLDGGTITGCYVKGGAIWGSFGAGGLVGYNAGTVRDCYSNALVISDWGSGGLVGGGHGGSIKNGYFSGVVMGGGWGDVLVGHAQSMDVVGAFWNTETSRQGNSAGGTGLTTAEMMTAGPFLEAGWDFVGEDENGTEDIWWIDEGRDYPRLWWEGSSSEL